MGIEPKNLILKNLILSVADSTPLASVTRAKIQSMIFPCSKKECGFVGAWRFAKASSKSARFRTSAAAPFDASRLKSPQTRASSLGLYRFASLRTSSSCAQRRR